MTHHSFPLRARVLGLLSLLVILGAGSTPVAHAADPSPSPTPVAGQQQTLSGRNPLPRALVLGLGVLAGAGAIVGLGAASVSLQERDDAHDRFIEQSPR